MIDKHKQHRQKSTDRLDNARVTNARTLAMIQRKARYITQRYPLRVWAMWTARKFGFWSHVVAGNFGRGGVRLTERDAREVNRVYDYIRLAEKRRGAVVEALRDCLAGLADQERRYDRLAREVGKL